MPEHMKLGLLITDKFDIIHVILVALLWEKEGLYITLPKRIQVIVVQRNVRKARNSLFTYPRNSILYKVYLWIAGRHWWILGLVAIILVSMETFDYVRHQGDVIHIFELGMYLALLFVVGVLIDMLITEVRIQNQTREILDYKHKLSLEFAGYHDWEGLVNHIVRFPGQVAPVRRVCLFVSDPISGQFIPSAQWSSEEAGTVDFCLIEECQDCLSTEVKEDVTFFLCASQESVSRGDPSSRKYCLIFHYGSRVLGFMPLLLEPGKELTESQVQLFENIADDIAIALQAGKDRQSFYEMRNSETALAERRDVSHYLHDHLGQSLGFLHIKMDQLIMEKDSLSVKKVYDDLEQMRSAVNESYEIVRGILETIHSETSPSLTNLMVEYARKISQRSNLKIDFKTNGKPTSLDPDIQRAVFYAFEESLSNAEKHSQASKVDILADWGKDQLKLTISDDGVGFNPGTVDTDQHFGMEILNERMAKVNGRITLTTSENLGTVVDIRVPHSMDGRLGGAA
jgi:signal transduction histidine kinase